MDTLQKMVSWRFSDLSHKRASKRLVGTAEPSTSTTSSYAFACDDNPNFGMDWPADWSSSTDWTPQTTTTSANPSCPRPPTRPSPPALTTAAPTPPPPLTTTNNTITAPTLEIPVDSEMVCAPNGDLTGGTNGSFQKSPKLQQPLKKVSSMMRKLSPFSGNGAVELTPSDDEGVDVSSVSTARSSTDKEKEKEKDKDKDKEKEKEKSVQQRIKSTFERKRGRKGKDSEQLLDEEDD